MMKQLLDCVFVASLMSLVSVMFYQFSCAGMVNSAYIYSEATVCEGKLYIDKTGNAYVGIRTNFMRLVLTLCTVSLLATLFFDKLAGVIIVTVGGVYLLAGMLYICRLVLGEDSLVANIAFIVVTLSTAVVSSSFLGMAGKGGLIVNLPQRWLKHTGALIFVAPIVFGLLMVVYISIIKMTVYAKIIIEED